MSDMVGGGSQYTDEQRKDAALQYAIEGSFSAIEKATGIPDSTVHHWSKQDWWHELIGEFRAQNQDRHIARYHELTSEALDMALDGIKNLKGDKLRAADIKALVVTGATATDKSRLLQGLSTSNPGGKAEGIAELKAQFEALAANHKRIEGSVVDDQ